MNATKPPAERCQRCNRHMENHASMTLKQRGDYIRFNICPTRDGHTPSYHAAKSTFTALS